jgi:2-hydroxychromene-2-carboxylate isomerase
MWEFFPSVGLDMARLEEDMTHPEIEAIVRQDMADAIALGVRKTPTFIANGQPLQRFGLPSSRRSCAQRCRRPTATNSLT